MFSPISLFSLVNLLRWIFVAGIGSFLIMGFDKLFAKAKRARVSEKTLWTVALLGGFLGIISGGLIIPHKVNKKSFCPPVIAAMVLWLVIATFIIF